MPLISPRRLVYAYVALVILEGALRKWLLPGALNPLIAIARDPIAVLLLWQGYRHGLFHPPWLRNLWLITTLALGFGGLVSMLFTSVPITVWLFGLRANMLHLPLILIIPALLDPSDLDTLIKRLLLLALPIALLMVWQYRSPLDAWINRTAIEGTSLLTAVKGKVRPAGPFSFNTGIAEYFALVNAGIAGGLLDQRWDPRWVLYGLLSTALAISVSGSRLMLGAVAVVWLGVLLMRQVRFFRLPSPTFLLGVAASAITLFLVLQLTPLKGMIDEGWATTSQRFEAANQTDGGVVARLSQNLHLQDESLWQAPLLGYGLGLGTNFGAKAISGQVGFALAESEIQRVILESGLLVGGLFLFFRFALASHLLTTAWQRLGLGEALPMALCLASLMGLLIGQIGRPTTLGFVVLSMAFSLSAARSREQHWAEPEPRLESA